MWVHAADVRAAGRHALDGIGRDIEHFRGCGIPRVTAAAPSYAPMDPDVVREHDWQHLNMTNHLNQSFDLY